MQEHLIVGSLLAAIVVFVFLGNLRSTLIAAIAIPTSIVATFALIWYMGFTLNMLTMLALTLSVGIVIDDAIVVLENIYRFIEEKGMPPMQAAVEATQEIGLAVMATTLSLVAIFAPVGFMSGMVGRFMAELRPDDGVCRAGVAVRELHAHADDVGLLAEAASRRATRRDSKHNRFFEPLDRGYTRLLEWAMAHRGLVAAGAVLVLLSSVPLFRVTAVNFTPEDDQSQFDITLRAPEGTSLAAMDVLANRLGAAVRRIPEVDFTLTTVAGDAAGTLNTASILVRLHPIDQRNRDQFAVMSEVRDRILPDYVKAGVRTAVQLGGGPGGGGGGIQFMVQGPDLKELEKYSEALRAEAKKIPGLVDIDTTLNAGKPEMSVLLDRPKAADLGVQVADAADALRLLVAGDQVTTFNEHGEQYEVHLRAEEAERGTQQAIAALPVPSSRLGIVTLDNIATFAASDSPATINRMGRQRQVTLNANMLPGTSQGAAQEADRRRGRGPQHGPRVPRRFRRPLARVESHRHRLPVGDRAVVHLHVSDPRRAVRVVAAPGDDPPVAAADAALRAAVADHLSAIAQHLFRVGAAGAVRRGEEEFDPADRSRQPAERARHDHARRRHPGQPRSAAADPDDDAGLRRGHDPAGSVERCGRRDKPRHRLGGHRWTDNGAAGHAHRDTRRVFTV